MHSPPTAYKALRSIATDFTLPVGKPLVSFDGARQSSTKPMIPISATVTPPGSHDSASARHARNSPYATLRFTTPTESVAAARSNVAPEMLRAITRTVLFDHTAALSSMNRVDETSDACARSPARAPLTVTSISVVAPGAVSTAVEF